MDNVIDKNAPIGGARAPEDDRPSTTGLEGLDECERVRSALQESEQRYRMTLDSISDYVHVVDRELQIVLLNAALRQWIEELGLGTEVVGRNVFDVFPFLPERVREEYDRVFAEGEVLVTQETTVVHGNERFTETRKIPVKAGAEVISVVTVIRDISEEKRVEEALREERDSVQRYLQLVGVILVAIEADERVSLINQKGCTVLGYAEDEILGENWFDRFVAERDRERVRAAFLALMGGTMEPVEYFENRLLTRNEERVVAWHNTVLRDRSGEITGTLSSGQDITERRRAEEALRASEAKYRSLFDNAADLIAVVSPEGTFLDLSRKFEEESDYVRAEVIGKNVFDIGILAEESAAKTLFYLGELLAGRPFPVFEVEGRRKDGLRIPYELRAVPIEEEGRVVAVQAILRNLTERKHAEEERARLEERIRLAQKLESLGILAGGIAHDFNNLLMGILGNADLALEDLPPDAPARARVNDVAKATRRAAELADQMLAYAGRGTLLSGPVDLSNLVTEMAQLLGASVTKGLTIQYQLADELPLIEGDATQLGQVVMNLITNAAEAIGDKNGTIVLRTGVMDATRTYLAQTFVDDDLPAGRYAYLEVKDTGCGMSEKTIARIFDPFYTTKFTGRGLGLAAVLGIVRGHKGALRVDSGEGRGTRFRVLFPCREPVSKPTEAAFPKAQVWRGTGTVLLVDDEQLVREAARVMLERIGYSVIAACDGHEALALFRRHHADIACVLLDLTMPHMDGEKALGELRAIRSDLPVLLSSGYSEQETRERLEGHGSTGFLKKPYRLTDLTQKLRALLGG